MKRMLQTLFVLCIFVTLPLSLFAQSSQAHNLVDIALNGQEVTVDGTLTDWNDAQFVFMSQDSPFFLQITNGNGSDGHQSPADFSAFVALKMTSDALYIAARVRDEGIPLYGAPATPNLAFDFDHISVYLGLYDIGNRTGSPHLEGPTGDSNFQFINPVNNQRITAGDITEGSGPDRTILSQPQDRIIRSLRSLEQSGRFQFREHTYNHALVDTTIGGTTAAIKLWSNERGYDVEWRIPLGVPFSW